MERPGHKEPLEKTARGPPLEEQGHASCSLSGSARARIARQIARTRKHSASPSHVAVGCCLGDVRHSWALVSAAVRQPRRYTFRAASFVTSHLISKATRSLRPACLPSAVRAPLSAACLRLVCAADLLLLHPGPWGRPARGHLRGRLGHGADVDLHGAVHLLWGVLPVDGRAALAALAAHGGG